MRDPHLNLFTVAEANTDAKNTWLKRRHECTFVVKFEIKRLGWYFLFLKAAPSFTFRNEFHYFVLRYKSKLVSYLRVKVFNFIFIKRFLNLTFKAFVLITLGNRKCFSFSSALLTKLILWLITRAGGVVV